MKCFAANREVGSHELTYWPLGFGSQPAGVVSRDCRLEFDVQEFVGLIAPAYAECIDELRRDDGVTGRFAPPFPGAEDYPLLDEFLSLKAQFFEEFFLDYLKLDLLSACLTEGRQYDDSAGRYVIYRVSGLHLNGRTVVVSGACFDSDASIPTTDANSSSGEET